MNVFNLLKLKKYRFNYFIILLTFILYFDKGVIQATPTEIASMMQAGRWKDINKKFSFFKPSNNFENFVYGVSLLENKKLVFKNYNLKEIKEAFLSFTKALDIPCKATNSQNLQLENSQKWTNSFPDIESCLVKIAPESRKAALDLIVINRATQYADSLNYKNLSLLFSNLASLENPNFYIESIFQKRLELLIQQKNIKQAIELSKRLDLFVYRSPFTNFMRARALFLNNEKNTAFYYYISSAQNSTEAWITKAIYTDIKNNYPELFYKTNFQNKKNIKTRSIVSLALGMNKEDINNLKKTFNNIYEIVYTATKDSLNTDGYFLLKSSNDNALIKLSYLNQNYFNKNPKVLEDYSNSLLDSKKYSTVINLLTPFSKVMQRNPTLWILYIKAIRGKDRNKSTFYIDEILKYLKLYPWHTSVHDLLMEALVGNDNKIDFAQSSHWFKVEKELPHFNSSGRFFYWLKVYYKAKNKTKELANLENNFYNFAPGSFYITEIWNSSNPKDNNFAKDWENVSSRNDYLNWITKYGVNNNALNFLAKQNYEKYLDPKTADLWTEINNVKLTDNGLIKTLFNIGDWNTAQLLYRRMDNNGDNPKKFYMQMIQLGKWSGLLNVQIYYMRQLLWESGVALDPFSIPEKISKLLYPRPYFQVVNKYAKKYGTDVNMNYALMHQESLFQEKVISRSGAQGLMQIMPATSKPIVKKLYNLSDYDMHNHDINIHVGIYFFSKLLKQYQNDYKWAAIAYNGGPGNLRKWKRLYYNGDFYHFLEALPNAESRNYCRITFENLIRYNVIYKLRPN